MLIIDAISSTWKKRATFWSSFIHIIDFTSHLPQEQLILCTFTHTPFADEPRFPNSYFCLVFFGRKTIPSFYHLFPFHLLQKQIQFGPTKTTFFTCFSYFIFYWVLFSLHLLSSEKYWEFVSIEKSSGNGILSCISTVPLSCINKVHSLLFLAASWEFYDVFHKVLIMKVLWSEREIFSLKIK